MRSIMLLLGTAFLLAGGFALYWALQSGGHAARDPNALAHRSPLPVQPSETTYTVGGGKGVWLKQYDQGGRLVNQFRAEEYDPQKEGFVRVAKPEARFFMKGGQWLQVTGRSGDVYVSGLPQAGSGDPFGSAGGGSAAAPSRGSLQDVHIQLYDAPGAKHPSIDMEVNNAAFDNESFRIYTEAYTDAGGKHVAADQVKVTVRGKYEFDGKGLTIRWNDRDQRLELLEIAHGERLVIKEPGAIRANPPGGAKPEASSARTGPADGPENDPALPDVPAPLQPASPPAAVVSPEPGAAPRAPEAEPSHYAIRFDDNVRVLQGEEMLAVGDSIEIHYALRNTSDPSSAATAPSPAPAAPTAPQSAPAPATQPVLATQPSPATEPGPAEKQLPYTVYWTGKLRITPSLSGPPTPLAPEQAAVQMRGSPAVLTRGNAAIRCPAFTYRTSDGGISLHSSAAFPQVEIAQFATVGRKGDPDMTLFSEWVEFAPDAGLATLAGKSRAEFPADETGESGQTARVTWNREGVIRFTGGEGETVVRDLQLQGDVDVQHPQIALQSQMLALTFAPPAAGESPKPRAAASATDGPAEGEAAARRPIVRHVTAREAVHCVLRDGSTSPRELTCDHLDLTTAADPAGKLFPRFVHARGTVRATEEGQELTADDLELVFAPAPPGKPAAATAFAAKPSVAKAIVPERNAAKSVAPRPVVAKRNAAMPVPAKPAVAKRNVARLVGANPAAQGAAGGAGQGGFDSGAFVLQRLVATTRVRTVSKEGAIATGVALVVTNVNGKPHVGLSGKPARVVDAHGNVLTSAKIVIPNADEARALGPGSLHAAVEPVAGEASRFMDVTWTGSALLNGKAKEDQIQVTGAVQATLPDADGTVNTASSQRILITMSDKPAVDRPPPRRAVKPANAEDAGVEGGPLGSTKMDVMNGKEVSRIILSKDAIVDRRLAAADGTVLREMRIESSLLHYHVKAQRFIAPRAGRMLVRDHSPADAGAAPKPAGARPAGGGLGSQRGATAFEWAESLDYDGLARRATMERDVVVAFRPDREGEPPVQLRADRVVAEFEAATEKPARAASARPPAVAAADSLARPPAPKLKSVTADGNVNVLRDGAELAALTLTYRPASSTIVATGTAANPAVFSRAGQPDSLSATEIHWNTDTWEVKVVDAAARLTPKR